MAKTLPITKLISTVDNLATVAVTAPAAQVARHRLDSLKHLAAKTTIKGFRQGKAPINIVEAQLDPAKITEHTLNHLIPDLVTTAVKEHQLNLIGHPHLTTKSAAKDADWEFEIRFPLKPEIKLGNYQEIVKSLNAKAQIIVPGKEPIKEEDRLQQILDVLLTSIQFTVPSTLVEDEVNQSLSRLLNQTEKLGLKIEDYLKTLAKTSQQLRSEYEQAARDNLRLELILSAIGQDLKIAVQPQQVDQLIVASASQEAKDQLDNPQQRDYIKAILYKRQTIDALLKL